VALGKNVRRVSDEALDRLVSYAWPGNVRELENMIERAVILTDSDVLEATSLPATMESAPASAHCGETDFSLKRGRKTFEAGLIRRALAATDGNRTHAARLLEISHRALLYKIKEYGIRDEA
jgi:two-component system response regulator AtoC